MATSPFWPESGGHRHLRNCGDTRNGFAAEPQGSDGVQLVLGLQLAGGMVLEGQLHLGWWNTLAIVGDPNPLYATTLNFDDNLRSLGVLGIVTT